MNANPPDLLPRPVTALACAFLGLAAPPLRAAPVIDGAASGDGYTTLHTQAKPSGWGNQNVLANLRAVQIGDTLHLFLAGRVQNNAIILWIDAKAGGVSQLTPTLISPQTGGEESYLNTLALDAEHGMTFEAGFLPESAIRIYGNESAGLKTAPVNLFDLTAGTHTYLGDSQAGVVAGGPIHALKTDWRDVPSTYANCSYGVEIALNLSDLGVAPGSQPLKLAAILVNSSSDAGSNQSLGSLLTDYVMDGEAVQTINFDSEPGTQTLTLTVTGLDPLLDQDGDGLSNGVETGTGVWADAANTGTDPYNPDTDGDGYPDGPEVAGTTALVFPSNPNIPNYTNISVPGSFNLPAAWQPNSSLTSPATAMSRQSTSLTGQYQWTLDYRFSAAQLGALDCKFTSNNSFAVQWGSGDSPGTIKRNGNNISRYVSASGFHRFYFDQAALTYTFGRRVFPDVAAFLAAYGLAPGGDADGDGISNQGEFAANTDPSNPDSDGDGISDAADSQPLLAVRAIVFRVDMHIQAVNGEFSPGRDAVKVVFFSGPSAPGELTLADPDGDDIYSATLPAVEGPTGVAFGEYKFFMFSSYGIYEDYISNRNFTLGPAHTPQALPLVFFNDIDFSYAYDNWSNSFSSHPGAIADDPDGDSFSNYQEFLFGSSPLDPTPALAATQRTPAGLVLRWLQRSSGATYQLEQSATLGATPWSANPASVTEDPDQSALPDGFLRMTATVPLDQPRNFIRISARE